MTTQQRCLWFVLDVSIPEGHAASAEAILGRWLQDLRHRMLGDGIEVHGGTGAILDVTTAELLHASRREAP